MDWWLTIGLALIMWSLGIILGHGIGYARAMRVRHRTTYRAPEDVRVYPTD